MIEFIIGKIINKREDYLVIQNNNMGYKVFTSERSLSHLEVGQEEALIYTRMIVREDDISLYGFTKEEEMDMFNLLIMVSRIGPRVAIGILSTLDPRTIKTSIIKKDYVSLCSAPGIGKKTAERIVLELKDRIDENELLLDKTVDMNEVQDFVNAKEAIEAIMTLGYSKYEAEKVVKTMDIDEMRIEDIIREALKRLSM